MSSKFSSLGISLFKANNDKQKLLNMALFDIESNHKIQMKLANNHFFSFFSNLERLAPAWPFSCAREMLLALINWLPNTVDSCV